jgi:putative transposase
MGVEEVLTAPRSPWQNPYVERLIGSIRRECLDHVIVFNEAP